MKRSVLIMKMPLVIGVDADDENPLSEEAREELASQLVDLMNNDVTREKLWDLTLHMRDQLKAPVLVVPEILAENNEKVKDLVEHFMKAMAEAQDGSEKPEDSDLEDEEPEGALPDEDKKEV